ncbi:MAG: nucleoside-diphosphate kinase [Candidatus Pacearchaeota archaeon]
MTEKTLVLIKPDGVQKQLIGEITKRFEENNLKISAMKMIKADEDLAKKHYPLDLDWAKSAFEKTKKSAEEDKREIPFSDHIEFGETLQSWLVDFITEAPVIAMVLHGPNAISTVRKLVGATEPCKAEKGTIRGDLVPEESYEKANSTGRALRNLIHASDSLENAQREISVWFKKHELHDY